MGCVVGTRDTLISARKAGSRLTAAKRLCRIEEAIWRLLDSDDKFRLLARSYKFRKWP